MDIQEQFYTFYKPYLKRVGEAIENGKSLILVGINSIGKTLLVEQILSKNFREDYLWKTKVHLVYLEFKDKNPPTTEQLYEYWCIQTAKMLNQRLPQKEVFNDFSFYSFMTEMIKNVNTDEKIAFVILDFQKVLDQNEAFFRSLIYLEWYSYGKVSYIVLSEPQILDPRNSWVQKFIQRLINYKFIFLPLFDKKTISADICREEKFNKTTLSLRHRSMIVKYSHGLHGVIGAFCYLLKDNPQVKSIRQLMKIVENDKMCNYWFKDLLDSLPRPSLSILKEISVNNRKFKRNSNNIDCRWLTYLGFLKKGGSLRFKYLLSVLNNFPIKEQTGHQLELRKNQFYSNGDTVKLTNKEFLVLKTLYLSKKKMVSYDKIGEVLWTKEPDKFSLWAISQLIKRLRKKLSDYFINPNTIRSRRGEGYVLN